MLSAVTSSPLRVGNNTGEITNERPRSAPLVLLEFVSWFARIGLIENVSALRKASEVVRNGECS